MLSPAGMNTLASKMTVTAKSPTNLCGPAAYAPHEQSKAA